MGQVRIGEARFEDRIGEALQRSSGIGEGSVSEDRKDGRYCQERERERERSRQRKRSRIYSRKRKENGKR